MDGREGGVVGARAALTLEADIVRSISPLETEGPVWFRSKSSRKDFDH